MKSLRTFLNRGDLDAKTREAIFRRMGPRVGDIVQAHLFDHSRQEPFSGKLGVIIEVDHIRCVARIDFSGQITVDLYPYRFTIVKRAQDAH